jgi:polyphenol oxidase
VFYLDAAGNYRTPALDQFGWLVYGFGTRRSAWPEPLATLQQVHSDVTVLAEGRTGCLGKGDALLSHTPGRLVGVKTADCLPVLLVDPEHKAVAAVHAGWRGTAKRIAPAAASAMCRHFGTRPHNLHAAIGPGIGQCCYEVGPEVAAEFGLSGRAHIDLAEINRQQLVEAGLPAGQIYPARLCTACKMDEFWSYRRDKEGAGRMLSFVGIG